MCAQRRGVHAFSFLIIIECLVNLWLRQAFN